MASGGLREMIPAISRMAVAVGVDGLFMEVHDNPDSSPVDGPTQWPLRCAKHSLCSYLTAFSPRSPSSQGGVGVQSASLKRAAGRPAAAGPALEMRKPRPGPRSSKLPAHLPACLLECRHLRRLLVELIAVAKASRGKEPFDINLTPIEEEEFDPLKIE